MHDDSPLVHSSLHTKHFCASAHVPVAHPVAVDHSVQPLAPCSQVLRLPSAQAVSDSVHAFEQPSPPDPPPSPP